MIRICQRLHSSVHSSGCSSIRSRESGRHPFHRIQPLLQLRERINISRQRLQILYLIAPNPTAVHVRQRFFTGGNSTFTRRIQGRNRLHTWTPGCTKEVRMTGTRRTARRTSAGCAESTSYYAVTTSAGGDHRYNKTAPGVSEGA